VLFLLDGLYVAKDQSSALSTQFEFHTLPFNGNWPCSIFASQDGVALESVALDFMRSESATFTEVNGNVDNYLHEASQADNPPSKTVYTPDGAGTKLSSLGVHEHWNNATDRKYSRNLNSAGVGIELVASRPSSVSVARVPNASVPGLKIIPRAFETEIITEGAFLHASVSIYNASGSLVRSYSQNANAGSGSGSSGHFIWDRRSGNGLLTAPGRYTITATAAGCQASTVIMILH
jgi:hypothetical protein